jgi:16S rRNA processing protein RimM
VKPHLELGYVRAAHGLDGEVSIRTHDPGSSALDEVERVWIRPRVGAERELRIEGVRDATQGDLLIMFEGIATRKAADALVGGTLYVFREDLGLEEGEMFQGDLLGLTAFDPSGVELGKIEQVLNNGPVPNLVIRGGGKEWMVPFIDEYVTQVDVEAGRVTVRPLDID